MPRKKINRDILFLKRYGLEESYVSLLLGVLAVVMVTIIILFLLQLNRKMNPRLNYSQIKTELRNQLNQQEGRPSQSYEVKEGDTLYSISQKRYGNPDLWPRIAQVNNISDPNFVYVGTKLNLPSNLNQQSKNKAYNVREGDNLWNIAVDKYGDGFRWSDVAKINVLTNPDLIFPDQKLILPK